MEKRMMSIALYSMLLLFYAAIVMYVFFAIVHADKLANFQTGMIFEIIGFVLLAYFIIGGIAFSPIKVGFFPALLIITIVYTVILDAVNLVFITTITNPFFVLINLVLLFVYCMVAIPIYIMGRK